MIACCRYAETTRLSIEGKTAEIRAFQSFQPLKRRAPHLCPVSSSRNDETRTRFSGVKTAEIRTVSLKRFPVTRPLRASAFRFTHSLKGGPGVKRETPAALARRDADAPATEQQPKETNDD
jgi:hypothetical protein